ncbi:MAG: hypothetical protein R3330_04780, partial [Saprospiraceae bacterium]|nr:hypothetical protein [Saprospiraceae bacterium]
MPTVSEEKAPHGRSISISKAGDSYSVKDKPSDHAKVQVTVTTAPANSHVQLPNGLYYAQGETAILTLEQLDQIDPAALGGGDVVITNDGFVDAAGGLIQEEGTIKSISVAGADGDDAIANAA